jgi:cytochrome c peroxidase
MKFPISVALAAVSIAAVAGPTPATLTPQEQLGKLLFFDKNLSDPAGQACAACHAPEVGYTGPTASINLTGAVYEGAVPGRFGNRKPPSAAYAGSSPILHFDGEKWVGGMFWDGRATGQRLGDPLAEQAQGPFLNPLEQNNDSAAAVVTEVLASNYQSLFLQVCGASDTAAAYECIARAIAAYERSREVNPFTSKYDYYLKGQAKLTGQEQRGLELFMGKAKCGNCHVAPLFTDFTYDNLGVPRNPLNPFYKEPAWNPAGEAWVDEGLGGFLKAIGDPKSASELGKHKVPTLRNAALRPSKTFVKAFGHNGYFKSLEEIVRFYNTRDIPGISWPPPEVPVNVNTSELGNLGLNHGEELAIVSFIETLSDGYVPRK